MRELFPDEVQLFLKEYGLPALPEYYDGPQYRDLRLYRQDRGGVTLTQCTLEDAREYCNRDNTSGPGWFCGFDRGDENDDEPGDGLLPGEDYSQYDSAVEDMRRVQRNLDEDRKGAGA